MTENISIIIFILVAAFVIAAIVELFIFIIKHIGAHNKEEKFNNKKKLTTKDFEESLRRNEGGDK